MKVEPDAPAAPSPPAPTGGRSRFGMIVVIVVAVTILVGIVMRFITVSDLWLDEALTVNIAKLPLGDIHAALRRDGAPPLYYLLLHFWMLAFGESDLAVRSLSGLLGVAMLPLAYFAGRRIGGADEDARRWTAWTALVVVAASPYAIRYSTENRMYMLTMVEVLLGYLALRAALDRPTFWRLAGVSVMTAALLYTQYWSLYLLVVLGAILVGRCFWAPAGERPTARKVTAAVAVGGLLWLPWVPTFLYQAANTGTPWATATSPPTAIAFTISDFAGSNRAEGWTLVLPLLLLALLGLFGRARDDEHVELDLRTVSRVRWEWIVGAGTLIVGLGLAFLADSAFQTRYSAIMFPLFALAVAGGILVFADRRIRYGVLAFVIAVGFVGGLRNVVTNRTQAAQVADVINAEARPGDVIGYCPDQVAPDVSRLVDTGPAVRQYTYPRFDGPERVDWVDYEARNRAASPQRFAAGLVRRANGHKVWMVWSPGYRTLETSCQEILGALGALRPRAESVVAADAGLFERMGLVRYDPRRVRTGTTAPTPTTQP